MSTTRDPRGVVEVRSAVIMALSVLPLIWVILAGAVAGTGLSDHLATPSGSLAITHIGSAHSAQPAQLPTPEDDHLPARAIKGPVASYVPQAVLLLAEPQSLAAWCPGDHAPPPAPSYDLDTTPG